jgi:hypothetical protein
MKKCALALLTLLLVGYSLPKQDVKVRVSTLPSGATLFVSCEGNPFEKMGVQMVVRYDGESSAPEVAKVEQAIQSGLERGGFSSKVNVLPMKRSPSNAVVFSMEVAKKRPVVIQATFRDISARLNEIFSQQDREVMEKFFQPKNIYFYLLGGFRKQLTAAPFDDFLACENPFSTVFVDGTEGYVALSYPRAAGKYMDLLDTILQNRLDIGLTKKCHSWECSKQMEQLFIEIESLRKWGTTDDEFAQFASLREKKNFHKWLREDLTHPNVEIGVPKNDLMLGTTLAELQESREWLSEYGFVPLTFNTKEGQIALCSIDDPFFTLPLTKSQGKKITTIIHSMGKDSVFKLLWKKSDLDRMGKDIEHVHPLCFLWYIFKRPQLAKDVRSFRHSYFKWSNFIDGCKGNFDLMARTDELNQYVPGFCRELDLDYDEVMRKVNAKDWDGLVDMLI